MKNKVFKMICVILSGMTILGALSSCTKDDDGVKNDSKASRWVLVRCSMHEYGSIGTGSYSIDYDQEFSYDSKGRVVSATYDDYTDKDNYTYKYEGNNIIADDGSVYTLGKNGFITSFKVDGEEGIAEYNTDGNITKMKWGNDSITYKWTNGLLTRYEYPDPLDSDGIARFDIEYYNSDIINADCATALNVQEILFYSETEEALAMCGFWGKMPNKPIRRKSGNIYTYEDIDSDGCPGAVSEDLSIGKITQYQVWKKL